MQFITGWDRQQGQLLPERVEEYVGADNAVRFVDVFVEALDLKAAGFVFPEVDSKGRGRPGYHPSSLLKLYLYGYLNQVRSSRRLEAECGRNLEVMWLLGKLKPDFKTIADFRQNNAKAFKAVVRQFTVLCRKLDLFAGQLLAVDGTKIKAQNAADQNWTTRKLEKQLAKLDERVQEYLQALDRSDHDERPASANNLSAEALQEKIAQLRERQSQVQQQLQQMTQAGETERSMTDPDSRGMRSKGKHLVGYNVQGVVDSKHHLLAVTEVTQEASDQGQLAGMVEKAKAELQIDQAEVVADAGYYKSEDIKACQDLGIEPHVPAANNSPSERRGLYGKADFQFEAQSNTYRCPAGGLLKYRRTTQDKGRKVFNYDNPKACAGCPLKRRCTQTSFRTVSRWEHEQRLERMAQKLAAAPDKMIARKSLIEHCWGTLHWLLPGGFLVKGLQSVGAEVSLAQFSYNFKRALAVVGLDRLIKAVKAQRRPNSCGKSLQHIRRRFGSRLGGRTPTPLLWQAPIPVA